jgi:hypothetical protein
LIRVTVRLSDKMRELAVSQPEFAEDLNENAQALDDAYECLFEIEPPAISTDEFLTVWSRARTLYTDLGGKV